MKKIQIKAMKVIYVLFLLLITSQCINEKPEKGRIMFTKKIAKGIYLERYNIYSGGVYAGDTDTYFLTDSIYFRCYLGKTMDDDQFIYCVMLSEDSVYAFKTERVMISFTPYVNRWDTLMRKTYSISALRKEEKWE